MYKTRGIFSQKKSSERKNYFPVKSVRFLSETTMRLDDWKINSFVSLGYVKMQHLDIPFFRLLLLLLFLLPSTSLQSTLCEIGVRKLSWINWKYRRHESEKNRSAKRNASAEIGWISNEKQSQLLVSSLSALRWNQRRQRRKKISLCFTKSSVTINILRHCDSKKLG